MEDSNCIYVTWWYQKSNLYEAEESAKTSSITLLEDQKKENYKEESNAKKT